MDTKNIEILDLDFEYKLWKNKLHFFKEELDLLRNRFEIIKVETPEFILSEHKVEFMEKQLKEVDRLFNKIKTMEREIAYYAVDYPIDDNHSHYAEHENIRDEMNVINLDQQYIHNNIYPLLCYPIIVK